MAPWDELPYFQPPQEVSVTATAANQIIFKGDPQCVLLVFSITQGTASTALLSTVASPGAGQGLSLSTQLPLVMNKADWGSLTTIPWFVRTPGGTAQATCVSVSLSKWPRVSDDS